MRGFEHRVPPPVLMLVVGAIMAAVIWEPWPAELSMGWRWGLARVFLVAAALFAVPAFVSFGRARTSLDPMRVDHASTLVTSGVYRVTRNPMYVSLVLLLCAWAAWLGRPVAVLGPVVFVLVIDRFQIVPEEVALFAKFGSAYADYRRAVRRWI